MFSLLTPIFGDIIPGYLGGTGYGEGGPGIAQFIASMIKVVYIVAGLAFFAFFAMGGLRYITAGGDAKATQEASKQITSAIIGLAIVVASYSVTAILGHILFGTTLNIFAPVFQ